MTAYEDTKRELAAIVDLRGDPIPLFERRVDAEGDGRRRGSSRNTPYVTIDEIGLDPISTQRSDVAQVLVTIYSRPDQVEVSHDVQAVKRALEDAKCSVRRSLNIGRVNDNEGRKLVYAASTLLIARRVPRR